MKKISFHFFVWVECCRVTGRFVEKNLDWKKKNGLSAGGKSWRQFPAAGN